MGTKKGQGALEYLMTYGWALLVIVVVAAALFALGVLNPATYQQKRCNGFQYFTWMDHQLDADASGSNDNFTIQVRNSNQDVAINSITVGTGSDSSPAVSDSDIQEGDAFVIHFNTLTGISTISAGDSYDNIQVTIDYNVTDGIPGNIDRATCIGSAA